MKKEKKVSVKCATPYCRGKAVKGRGMTCGTCKTKKWREANPVKYAFDTLRTNAKRRGHVFALTFAEFSIFCEATKYMEKKGITGQSLSIDRIDPRIGYVITNIQVMTLSGNSRKRWVDYWADLEINIAGNVVDVVPVEYISPNENDSFTVAKTSPF